jgi:hypothetical protein
VPQNGEWVARESGDTRLSLERIELALQLNKQLPVPDLMSLHDTVGHAAMAYLFAGQIEKAVRNFEQSAVLLASLHMGNTASADVMSSNWASLCFYVGRPLEGMALARRARQIRNSGNGDAPDAVPGFAFDDMALRHCRLPAALAFGPLASVHGRTGHVQRAMWAA